MILLLIHLISIKTTDINNKHNFTKESFNKFFYKSKVYLLENEKIINLINSTNKQLLEPIFDYDPKKYFIFKKLDLLLKDTYERIKVNWIDIFKLETLLLDENNGSVSDKFVSFVDEVSVNLYFFADFFNYSKHNSLLISIFNNYSKLDKFKYPEVTKIISCFNSLNEISVFYLKSSFKERNDK